MGEIQLLAQKATRGAGRPVGQAEDAGRAVRWLCAIGHDGAGALDALLRATDGARAGASESEAGLCPLALGGYLSDMGVMPDGPLGPVISPLLLVPFLADLAGDGGISMTGQGVALDISPHGVTGAALLADAVLISVQYTKVAPATPALKTRVDVPQDTFASLQTFAARTYAPATEDSRARGAGAGTSDND